MSKPATVPVRRISAGLNLDPLIARLLVNREISSVEDAELFLSTSLSDLPSPFLMKGMEEAVGRLKKSVYEKEKIGIYGDYDVDGVTATCLLHSFLRSMDCDVTYYIPDRFNEGYGVSFEGLEYLKARGVELVVSVDCGITSADEVMLAGELGMDFIVSDHHSFSGSIPRATAVINPRQPDCRYPGKEVAGVGVAFNLALALRRTLREEGFFEKTAEPNLGDFLDLVALGTVADCVPVKNVNRIMIKEGLKRIENPKRPGIAALNSVCEIEKGIDASDLGFRLGPRINAAGRMASADSAVELLLSRIPEEAHRLAKTLDCQNSERKKVENEIREDAVRMAESLSGSERNNSIVLASRKWHKGVLGIVASSIARYYQKPAFLIAVDENSMGTGSGRSFGGIDIYSILCSCGDVFEKFGGHANAAGVTIAEEKISVFSKRFSQELERSGQKPENKLKIDLEVSLCSIDQDFVSKIESLAPFGEENPEPVFLSKSIQVSRQKLFRNRTLSFLANENGATLECIWFYARQTQLPEKIDMVFSLGSNGREGREEKKSPRLFVKDVRDAGG